MNACMFWGYVSENAVVKNAITTLSINAIINRHKFSKPLNLSQGLKMLSFLIKLDVNKNEP